MRASGKSATLHWLRQNFFLQFSEQDLRQDFIAPLIVVDELGSLVEGPPPVFLACRACTTSLSLCWENNKWTRDYKNLLFV